MALTTQRSLFEPERSNTLETSLAWIDGLLFGEIAIGMCTLAMAAVGGLMLTGRLPLRDGLRVVIGCFVLLGAPVIAAGIVGGSGNRELETTPTGPPAADNPPRGNLPPANYDPYSGA